ncbi:MAG: DUF1045 domain-containing protein [Pirellulales bacterium]|nr:DUF1045 domain-containing protein [Pirellulales bacterium]
MAPEAESPLATFGRRWLGHDPATGDTVDGETFGLEPDLARRAVESPSLYGLHATLKAPFRLRPGCSPEALQGRLAAIASDAAPAPLGYLSIASLGGFLALLPERTTAVRTLANRCLFGLEAFRAPLTDAEREKRLKAQLTTNQRLLLETYGYPYVLSEFRFHITLTGRLDDRERESVATALAGPLQDVVGQPFEIRSLCLFVQPAAGARFRLASRWPLCV